jgi:hypothetical protein
MNDIPKAIGAAANIRRRLRLLGPAISRSDRRHGLGLSKQEQDGSKH